MLGFPFRLGNLRAGRNHHGDPNPETDRGKAGSPPQGARCRSVNTYTIYMCTYFVFHGDSLIWR
jgi:hypothetical protein